VSVKLTTQLTTTAQDDMVCLQRSTTVLCRQLSERDMVGWCSRRLGDSVKEELADIVHKAVATPTRTVLWPCEAVLSQRRDLNLVSTTRVDGPS